MKMYPLEVQNNDPNRTLADWLSANADNYKIHAIVLREENDGTLYWYIFHVD